MRNGWSFARAGSVRAARRRNDWQVVVKKALVKKKPASGWAKAQSKAMRYVSAVIGGLIVFVGVAMLLLFVVGHVTEGLPLAGRYAAWAGCWIVASVAAIGSVRATLARR